MITVIISTPIYVWFLLAYLVWGGVKARKTYTVAWKHLALLPLIMLIWSLYSTSTRYGISAIGPWAISMLLGLWLGSLTTRKAPVAFDKENQLIRVAGNWTPLALSLSIFPLRYLLGVTYSIHPHLVGDPIWWVIESLATLVSGMFFGRLLGYYRLYKRSPHTPLTPLKKLHP